MRTEDLLQIGGADTRSLKKIKRRRIEYTSSIYFFKATTQMPTVAKDKETGLYYYGARYLDPKYSRWMSGDPAMGKYVPQAPINDEARKHNEKLPGMGGVFNTVNLHVYHYAGNNPVKYVDPDGRENRSGASRSEIMPYDFGGGSYGSVPIPSGKIVINDRGLPALWLLIKGNSKAKARAITKANTKRRKERFHIRVQIQLCRRGCSNVTIASSGEIDGPPHTGVTKEQALQAVEMAKAKLLAGSGYGNMVKSDDFRDAVEKLKADIRASAPVPDGKNVIKEPFTYRGDRYRIDLDSFVKSSPGNPNKCNLNQ